MSASMSSVLELTNLSLPRGESSRPRGELGQEEFFELMTTQLRNQDPFKPLESGEFLGQLAQFASVSGVSQLNRSFESLAASLVSAQALQGAALVGRVVLVESGLARLAPGGTVQGAVQLSAGTSSVQIEIQSASGERIRVIDLGAQKEGRVHFTWAGESESGIPAEPGAYRIIGRYFSGTTMQSVPVQVAATVDSVRVGAGGLVVNLDGLGEVPFSSVREIK